MPPLRSLFLALALLAPVPGTADTITVFAAASLRTALDEVAAGWQAETGHHATLSFAGSSALARQIQLGAPADLFLSASPEWIEVLEADGLVDPARRVDLLGNTLVLIGHGADLPTVPITPDLDLAGMLAGGYLAMALVDAVPAGQYGRAALRSLGLWDSVAGQIAQTDNVRAALALVALGEAPLGIVYGTDARAEPRVSVLGVFPPDGHPPIIYPAVPLGENPAAEAFLTYLQSPAARAAFGRHGFAVQED